MEFRFILEDAPHSFAHASTIVETSNGLLAAWFGGDFEGSPETSIWLARFDRGTWCDHRALAKAEESESAACWNPVLHRSPGCTLLFYRIGPHPRDWQTELMLSPDEGKSWQPAGTLPEPYFGPIKNKPLEIEPDILLCPSSTENPVWNAHIERYAMKGRRWLQRIPLRDTIGLWAIQPTLLRWSEDRIQALCRTRKGVVAESWSHDKGETWSELEVSELENPNSGFDGVVLRDGRAALVANPSAQDRTPLQIVLSDDGGNWRAGPVLEDGPGEFSYPAIIQAASGAIQVTYTYDRRCIRHVELDPSELE